MGRTVQKIPLASLSSDFKDKLLTWAQTFDTFAWLDSNDYPQQYSTFEKALAVGAEKVLQTDFQRAFDKLQQLVDQTQDYVFGYLSYDLKNDLEQLGSANFDGLQFPELFFFQPQKLFFFHKEHIEVSYLNTIENQWETDFQNILQTNLNPEFSPTEFTLQSRISQVDYLKKVNRLQQYIRQGDTYEANFCMEFFADNITIDPLPLFTELNRRAQAPFSVFFKHRDQYLLSASPERFIRKEGSKVITQPIKGTARRGKTEAEDVIRKEQLAQNLKERTENIMIVDLVRNDLSKTASKGSVQVEELCKIYTFPTVHQMISTVSSTVKEGVHPVEVVKSMFPMGSMTGVPKISTLKIIEELEETKRGLYSGAFGYFTPNGDFDFNVVIRSIVYNAKNQYLSFSVGGAVTSKSVPEHEYEECLLKAENLQKTLEIFKK